MIKSSLNNKQYEAVSTIKGPVIIIAGPGTGKTKTLVERTVNILVSGKTDTNKIIITTFTNKAARELEYRINKKLEEIGKYMDISDMYIGTMHSVWFRLIEENIDYSNFFSGFELMTSDYEQHFFIYSKLKEYKNIEGFYEFFRNISLTGDWEISGYIRKKINNINENAIDIKEIRSSDKYINFIKDAYSLYEEQMIKENKIDFSYLQIEFFNMLKNNYDFLEKINSNIDYVMVDEYQDSNKIQEKILFLITKKKKNLCVVGDEDQSIYRFRGATSENIINFPKHFLDAECKQIILDKNYRSVSDIVNFNNSWIKNIDWKGNRYEKELISMRTDEILGTNVFNISGTNSYENIERTVKFIKDLKSSGKITNYNQVAVLFSSFNDSNAKKLENALTKNKIDVYSPRTKVFFEMTEIKITFGIILACFKTYVNLNEYLNECLTLARYEVKKDEKLLKFIKNRIENIETYEVESFNNFFYELFQFDYYKNIYNDTTKNVDSKTSRVRYNFSILSTIFKDYQRYIKYSKINSENNFTVVRYFFERYLGILKRYRTDIFSTEEDYPNDCVPFLTIHQAKGLEFPVVIVYSLYAKPEIRNSSNQIASLERLINPETKFTDMEKEIFDFYRKYYVAFTRAKNLLILSSNEKNISEIFKPFFYSLPSISTLDLNKTNSQIDKIDEKKESRIFSFTADITLYKTCSMKYFLIRELNLKTFVSKKLNIGVIVHKIIEHINKILINNNERFFSDEYIKNLITKIYVYNNLEIDENFERIFLLIKNYLENEIENFKYIKKVESSEYRIENNYNLYGKIDLILEKENEIELIDFKTGKLKNDESLFETYKEQISLYKFLLQKKINDNSIKKIKTNLYYLEEEKPRKEVYISEEELEENIKNIEKIIKNIFDRKFYKREFDKKICINCEMKYYCYGELL